eukprot:COSAG04_NODE_24650_length_318_cov_7.844749_1_plen_22_part_01
MDLDLSLGALRKVLNILNRVFE